jgi:hypothetical protein
MSISRTVRPGSAAVEKAVNNFPFPYRSPALMIRLSGGA